MRTSPVTSAPPLSRWSSSSRPSKRVQALLIALGLAAWFLDHTWRGLLCTFQGDDVMNLYQAWVLPPWRLIFGNLTPFSTVYRPVGSVFYRLLFASAGFHALPYRIVIYALLLLNIALLYRFASLLTGSSMTAALAALLGSYHKHAMDLYQNGGAVYDILCYTFFLAAFIAYIRGGRILFLVFALLALNSKEMALMLAPAVWLYEFVYAPDPSCRRGNWALWILTIATPIAAMIKTGPGSAFYHVGGYAFHLTSTQWIDTTRFWIEGLFYLPYQFLTTTEALLFLLLPWAIALSVRDPEKRKPILLCAALTLLLPLPVNFIDQRNFFVMYLPLAAWSIIVAHSILMWAPRFRLPMAVASVVLLHFAQHHDRFRGFEWIDPTQPAIRAFTAGLTECAPLHINAQIEVVDDPFDKTGWDPTFITRLTARDQTLDVHRTPPASSAPPADHYDCTLLYRDGRFVRTN